MINLVLILVLSICLLLILIILIAGRKNQYDNKGLFEKLGFIEQQIVLLESGIRKEIRSSRSKQTTKLERLRKELFDSLIQVTKDQTTSLKEITNSLNNDFNSLVEKSENQHKTEFEKFGGILEKARKNINAAEKSMEELISERTNAICRKLKSVETLTGTNTARLLDLSEKEEEQILIQSICRIT